MSGRDPAIWVFARSASRARWSVSFHSLKESCVILGVPNHSAARPGRRSHESLMDNSADLALFHPRQDLQLPLGVARSTPSRSRSLRSGATSRANFWISRISINRRATFSFRLGGHRLFRDTCMRRPRSQEPRPHRLLTSSSTLRAFSIASARVPAGTKGRVGQRPVPRFSPYAAVSEGLPRCISSPMLDQLGPGRREARLGAGRTQLDVATAAGVSHAVISRLETGTRWPRDPDQVIGGYERECGLLVDELWRRAMNRA